MNLPKEAKVESHGRLHPIEEKRKIAFTRKVREFISLSNDKELEDYQF